LFDDKGSNFFSEKCFQGFNVPFFSYTIAAKAFLEIDDARSDNRKNNR